MLVLELGLLSLFSLLHSALSTCQKWEPSSQSRQESLFLYFASGRFSARLSPYVIFLILRYNVHTYIATLHTQWNVLHVIQLIWGLCLFREKHGLNVMVDRECLNSVTKYFDLNPSSLLPGDQISTLHIKIFIISSSCWWRFLSGWSREDEATHGGVH